MNGTIKRYSMAFKQKVIREIESGELSIGDAPRLYDITGNDTVQNWLRKLGKNQQFPDWHQNITSFQLIEMERKNVL